MYSRKQVFWMMFAAGLLSTTIKSGLELFAQERAHKPLQIWEVKSANFTNGSWGDVPRIVLVYKFQVGTQAVCKAFVVHAATSASLGDVPCEE